MEQRIDPNAKQEFAASLDPAFVPGLVGPRPSAAQAAESEDAPVEDSVPDPGTESDSGPESGTESGPEPESGSGVADVPEAEDGSDTAVTSDTEDGEEKDEEQDDEQGPVFEVSDRRGSITANREGIRFRLDDQEADFRWDEIGAVEVKPQRFGRRFTVTVHMTTKRWFNAEVEAESRARLKEWADELDAALDAYFEE